MWYPYFCYATPRCAWRTAILASCLAGLMLAACTQQGDNAAELAAIDHSNIDEAAIVVEMPTFEDTPDAAAEEPDAVPDRPLGEFQVTYYWMASEGKGRAKRDIQLYTKRCKPLTKVSKSFAARLAREGTGELRDGRTINVSGECTCDHSPCFFTVGKEQRWGVGVYERPLSPFRSVAVDPAKVSIGTILYVPELDGLTMPGAKPWGGFVHDGCVVADDTGGNVSGNQIDLFVAHKPHYYSFYRRYRIKRVTLLDGKGRCEHDGDKLVPVNRNSI